MITLIVNKGNCKCMSCTMTKYGLDYFCNRCGKPEFDITDDDFKTDEFQEELRADLDAEMRMEANDVKAEMLRGDENI